MTEPPPLQLSPRSQIRGPLQILYKGRSNDRGGAIRAIFDFGNRFSNLFDFTCSKMKPSEAHANPLIYSAFRWTGEGTAEG